jgi:hypothetical protein
VIEKSTAWQLLHRALEELRAEAHAHNAYLLDESGRLWCSAVAFTTMDPTTVVDMMRSAIARLETPLRRGGVLNGAVPQNRGSMTRRDYAYVRSFANLYVLMIRFSAPFDVGPVTSTVDAALSRIERLTLSLPPPSGPGDASGEGAVRA